MAVYVKLSWVVENSGTVVLTTHRLTDVSLDWRVGDRVELPLASGGTAIATISAIGVLYGAGVGPDQTYLSLEFAGIALADVKSGGELVLRRSELEVRHGLS